MHLPNTNAQRHGLAFDSIAVMKHVLGLELAGLHSNALQSQGETTLALTAGGPCNNILMLRGTTVSSLLAVLQQFPTLTAIFLSH